MKQVYNPFLPLNEYIPDGEPHVFNDRVYLFGSHDKEGGTTFCELDYVSYSADVKDLTDWKFEGVIYSSAKDPHSREIFRDCGERKYLYAPDVVQGIDGRFYLYYCLSAKGGGAFNGPISVAVCDTPAGEYEYYGDVKYSDGRIITRFIPFDPAVLNDDGKIFLYYGFSHQGIPTYNLIKNYFINRKMAKKYNKTLQEIRSEPDSINGANVVELESDMLTVKNEPKRLIPSETNAHGTDFEGYGFFEASSIRKIKDIYYFVYSTYNHHELAYATSIYPDKNFKYGGVIISNGDVGYNSRTFQKRLCQTGNNHGGIECIDGQWYVFFHRHTHMSSYSRQACAQKIDIQEDGFIPQVEITSCGLNGKPLKTEGEYPAVIACNLTDWNIPHVLIGNSYINKPQIANHGEERFIQSIGNGTLVGFKYFNFLGKTQLTVRTRGSGRGKLFISSEIGGKNWEIIIDQSENWVESNIDINLLGVLPLYLTYSGQKHIDLITISFK